MELQQRIENINSFLETVDEGKVGVAVELFETKRDNYWKDTTYGSWRAFCDKEIALSQASIVVYIKTAELMEKLNLKGRYANKVIDAIGWERFRIGLTKVDQTNPITPTEFINRYKGLNLNERVTYEKSESELVKFSFGLPPAIAAELNTILVARGMRVTNKSRTNISAAMAKLVKELVETE